MYLFHLHLLQGLWRDSSIEVCCTVDLKWILYSWTPRLNCHLHTHSCQPCQSLCSYASAVFQKKNEAKKTKKKPRIFYLTRVYPTMRDGSPPLATIKPHFQSCNSNSFFLFPDFLLMSCQSNRGNLWEERRGKAKRWGVWRSRQRGPASTSDQSLHKCSWNSWDSPLSLSCALLVHRQTEGFHLVLRFCA